MRSAGGTLRADDDQLRAALGDRGEDDTRRVAGEPEELDRGGLLLQLLDQVVQARQRLLLEPLLEVEHLGVLAIGRPQRREVGRDVKDGEAGVEGVGVLERATADPVRIGAEVGRPQDLGARVHPGRGPRQVGEEVERADHADQAVVLDHENAMDAVHPHEVGQLGDGGVRRGRDDDRGHDVAHQRVGVFLDVHAAAAQLTSGGEIGPAVVLALGDHLVTDVKLVGQDVRSADHAHQPLLGIDHRCPEDPVLGQDPGELRDRRIVGHRDHITAHDISCKRRFHGSHLTLACSKACATTRAPVRAAARAATAPPGLPTCPGWRQVVVAAPRDRRALRRPRCPADREYNGSEPEVP